MKPQRVEEILHSRPPDEPDYRGALDLDTDATGLGGTRRLGYGALTAAIAATALVAVVIGLVLGQLASNRTGGPSPSTASETPQPSLPVAVIPTPSASTHLPAWCPGVPSGGPGPGSGETPRPIPTIDLHHLRCIEVENKSHIDMGMQQTQANLGGFWWLLSACGDSRGSEVLDTAWSLNVGRAKPGAIEGPILASFESSQLTGDAPYLIQIVIDPDGSVTIRQTDSLPDIPQDKFC
jgi:hypothetical protein